MLQVSRRSISFRYLYRLPPYLYRPSPFPVYTSISSSLYSTTSTKSTSAAKPHIPAIGRTFSSSSTANSKTLDTKTEMAVDSVTLESLTAEVAAQSQVLNELRKQQGADPAIVEEAKKKLGELKRSLAVIQGAGGGSKEGKKKERLLLKVPKVSIRSTILSFVENSTLRCV